MGDGRMAEWAKRVIPSALAKRVIPSALAKRVIPSVARDRFLGEAVEAVAG